MKLADAQLQKLIPAFMRDDPAVKALAGGTDNIARDAAKRLRLLTTWDHIDTMTDQELDELAWELDVRWYKSTAPLEAKRRVIRQSDLVHAKLGTKWATEQVASAYFGECFLGEWWLYGGRPGCFKIYSNEPQAVIGNIDGFLSMLYIVKRLSAWLDAIVLLLLGWMDLYAGVVYKEYALETSVFTDEGLATYFGVFYHDDSTETIMIGG